MVNGFFDLVILGSGPGGSSLAYALRDSGMKIAVLEAGDFWPKPNILGQDESANMNEGNVDRGIVVGGMMKRYEGALVRFRRQDFDDMEHFDGLSPGWPIKYGALEKYYEEAEKVLRVHGKRGEDPTDPRETEYPFAPIQHHPFIDEVLSKMTSRGKHPVHLPLGVAKTDPKGVDHVLSDADTQCLTPAIAEGNVKLLTGHVADHFVTDASGKKIVAVEGTGPEGKFKIEGDVFALACGALHSPAVLLRSQGKNGRALGDGSGQVGRNFMAKNVTLIEGFHPKLKEMPDPTKTWGLHDFYFGGGPSVFPLGIVQSAAVYSREMRESPTADMNQTFMKPSMAMYVANECIPKPENRVVLGESGVPRILFRPNNLAANMLLTTLMTWILSAEGFNPRIIVNMLRKKEYSPGLCTHVAGSLRMGDDPSKSVVDSNCKAHDVDNLYVVDSSFFPGHGAMNPTLTVVANSFRVGDHLRAVFKAP